MKTEKYRVGRKVGRTIYRNDELVGVMDTPELARLVVAGLNDKYRQALEWNNVTMEERIQSLEAELRQAKEAKLEHVLCSYLTCSAVASITFERDELSRRLSLADSGGLNNAVVEALSMLKGRSEENECLTTKLKIATDALDNNRREFMSMKQSLQRGIRPFELSDQVKLCELETMEALAKIKEQS